MTKEPIWRLVLVAVLAIGCAPQEPSVRPRPNRLTCIPSVVSPGGTVTLRFQGSHGRELGVWTPDKRFLFIAFQQETPDSVPPVPSERFLAMQTLNLNVATAVGLSEIGAKDRERIFKSYGTYHFVVSDNLETEDDLRLNGVCHVRFSRRLGR